MDILAENCTTDTLSCHQYLVENFLPHLENWHWTNHAFPLFPAPNSSIKGKTVLAFSVWTIDCTRVPLNSIHISGGGIICGDERGYDCCHSAKSVLNVSHNSAASIAVGEEICECLF